MVSYCQDLYSLLIMVLGSRLPYFAGDETPTAETPIEDDDFAAPSQKVGTLPVHLRSIISVILDHVLDILEGD